MRAKELRDQDQQELRTKEAELREEIFRSRLRRGAGQLPDAMKIRNLRRDLARVLTVLREAEAGKGAR